MKKKGKSKLWMIGFMVLLLFAACSDKPNKPIQKIVVLSEYEMLCSDAVEPWGAVTGMEIADSLIVLNHANGEYHFTFIHARSGKLLKRWGKTGNGSNEFLDFGGCFSIAPPYLVFNEMQSKSICKLSLEEILEDKGGNIQKNKEKYPYTRAFRTLNIALLGNQRFALGAFQEGRLGVFNALNDSTYTLFDYPYSTGVVEGIYRGITFQGEIKANEKQQKFVVSTFGSDVFEIYTVEGNSVVQSFVSPLSHVPQIVDLGGTYTLDAKNNIGGFRNLFVSDELIAFTYFPQSYEEASKNEFSTNEIHCFDWEGNPIRKYILPFPITEYCMDKHYLYGVCYEEDDIKVYRFKI